MAFFSGSIFSHTLRMYTGLCAIVPNDMAKRPDQGFPTVYLLHGMSGNSTCWTRFTSIERYADDRGLAVIMPEVQRSFYTDMRMGLRYFTYIADELPELSRDIFGLSRVREDNFVAGLSMGGYGALKCLFSRPETFCAGASLSGAVDMKAVLEGDPPDGGMLTEAPAIFGDPPRLNADDDLFELADKAAKLPLELRPRVMTCCGTDDVLTYDMNRRFREYMEKTGLEYRYGEGPGVHDWKFWDEWIVKALDFFLEKNSPEK